FWFNDKGFVYNLRKHVFVLDLETNTVRQITKGEVDVAKAAWSHDGRRIAYVAQTEDLRPYIQDLFLVDAASGRTTQLTKHDMEIASVTCSPDDRRLVFLGNDFPRGFASHVHLWSINAAGGKPECLDSLDRNLSNSLNCDIRRVGLNSEPKRIGNRIYCVMPEGFTFRMSDGAAIVGWILRPPTKGKVTTMLYVHGGPRTAFGYSYLHEFQVFAAKGYAVLYTNPRGSDGYAEEFADIRGHYG